MSAVTENSFTGNKRCNKLLNNIFIPLYSYIKDIHKVIFLYPQSRNQPDADFDPFGLDRFLSEAKRADKSTRKRDHHDRHDMHGKKRRD